MVKLIKGPLWYVGGKLADAPSSKVSNAEGRNGTIAYGILNAHNIAGQGAAGMSIKFDSLASHDITYVGIIQTARASGLEKFPIPYILTNCHNSLCAVGGTINEDDHVFGLSAARRYGGIFVPPHMAVIHAYMREMMSGCGRMILGSDSHTRYGALGTLAVGEGGPELVKQLLGRTYDIAAPEVIAVELTGSVRPGVGPQDVALAIIAAVFKDGFVKNRILEFIGDGIAALPIEFRNGIDVMTTETTCLSSIWMTDEATRAYFENHGRPEAYKKLAPAENARYDGAVCVDLSKVESMIALPFHPSNAMPVRELLANPRNILGSLEIDLRDKVTPDGRVRVDQGVIAGCAGGTFDNLCAASDYLSGRVTGSGEFALSAYPASQPVLAALIKNGVASNLITSGVTLRTAFCGPCFGAGDVPANGGLSIRHSTRNFPNREGSKPSEGQSAAVALMDARSIAATAANGSYLTAADSLDIKVNNYVYEFDDSSYRARVYNGYGKADPSAELKFGPNIVDWPEIPALSDNLLMEVCSVIDDEVTTTDELIPSGESSSYRSNPLRLAQLTLSRRDPGYVERAKAAISQSIPEAVDKAVRKLVPDYAVGSLIYANKPGDGSAREQAASCQRVLGGSANIAREYATKRYRSNLINWGMLPFTCSTDGIPVEVGDRVLATGLLGVLSEGKTDVQAYIIKPDGGVKPLTLSLPTLTADERQIIIDGCLINYYKSN